MTSKKIPPFFGLPKEWKYEMRVKDEHIEALRDLIATLTAERDRYREALEESCTGPFNPIWEKSGKLFTCRDKHNDPEQFHGYGLRSPCPACAALITTESEKRDA